MRTLYVSAILSCLLLIPGVARAQSASVEGLRGVKGVVLTVAGNDAIRESGYSDAQMLADVARHISSAGIPIGDSLTTDPNYVQLRITSEIIPPEMGNNQRFTVGSSLSVRPLQASSRGSTAAASRGGGGAHFAFRTSAGPVGQAAVQSLMSEQLASFVLAYNTANPRQ